MCTVRRQLTILSVDRPFVVRNGQTARLSAMTRADIDHYLVTVEEAKRSTLETLRRTILEIIPEAEQCISYGAPAFKLEGKVVAGFAAFKNHLSYSPIVDLFPELETELRQYKISSGALRFPVDRSLPKPLARKLSTVRKRQALGR
jgi:uncharacterized protein YdhG (YjbR/CyaY superfamily)